ncbi:hypothetical protein AAVH_05954 [Aphelenchoides avenae]|nr:hypothetical protein AAVH_05954 [Aphelenchus avenae]
MLPVLNDELVDKNPDELGTNFGHICQKPSKLAELVALLPPELRRADGATDGVTLEFRLHGSWRGDARRNHYHCVVCWRYLVRTKMFGVKTATICVLDGEIVDKDPDDAGTDHGHLCQELEKFGLQQSEANVGRRQSGAREVTKSFGLAGFVDGERKRMAYESRRYEDWSPS